MKRRTFLGIVGGGIVGGVTLGGQEGHGDTRPVKEFHGTSRKGDMEEALNKAIAAAQSSIRHPDGMVNWTLKTVSGRQGGIAGFREVTVTIEAQTG